MISQALFTPALKEPLMVPFLLVTRSLWDLGIRCEQPRFRGPEHHLLIFGSKVMKQTSVMSV